jgi:hypothetical protein
MPEEIADREKVADAVLDRVKHYTIGFARAGETPAAKGSGVLIKHGGRHGILTCTHVDKYLRDLKRPIGIVRLNQGLAQQSATLEMEEVFSYAAGEEPWEADDIAFIHLPPHLVGNIEKDCVFLDADKNFTKPAIRHCQAEAQRSVCLRSTSPATTVCACPPCAHPRSAGGRPRGL